MSVNFAMLKFFWVKSGSKPKNRLLPKTLRFRKNYVLDGRLMAKGTQKNGFSTVVLF
jgi:hypothetical protein